MNFSFELTNTIKQQVEIIDAALVRLNQPPFFENLDFVFDGDSAGTFQLIARRKSCDRNFATIEFHLLGDGLRVDIDNIPETFMWSSDEITNKHDLILAFLCDMLRCFVLVERSKSGIVVKLFDPLGNLIDSINVRNLGLFPKNNLKDITGHLFFPIYAGSGHSDT
ncbi:MAG: hypothetical protein ABL999_16510 [Pyrinomonadaceae bacterium]